MLPDYFRLADVLAMPSTGEGFGIAFLEALASGLRVIGGNQDGSLDAPGNGSLATAVDPENREELASAIRAALNSPTHNGYRADRFKQHLFTEHLLTLMQSSLAA